MITPPDANPAPPVEAPTPAAPPANPTPAAPPAAKLVEEGAASEETLQLRRDLETERKARRDAETKAAEAERDRQNLLTPPAPKPEKPKRKFATLLNHPWKD